MNTKVKKEVINAYNKDTPNLHFRASQSISIDDAVSIMTTALELTDETENGYNAFSPSLLRHLPAETKVLLAREYSVCIYIILEDITLDISNIIKKMKVDECSLKENKIRLWWD